MKTKPNWIDRILETFLESIEWTNIGTPINHTFSYRCSNDNNYWEITFSPWVHEIYGGKHDGALKVPFYEINLLTVADEFDKVSYIGFDTDRFEATIEGKIEDSLATLIFRKLPPTTKFHKKVNTYTGEVTKIAKKI